MPLFMVASAAETKPASRSSNVPKWQLVAANLGAGASAGCAVEAGEPVKVHNEDARQGTNL